MNWMTPPPSASRRQRKSRMHVWPGSGRVECLLMKLLHAAGIHLINTVTAVMNTAIIVASRTTIIISSIAAVAGRHCGVCTWVMKNGT